MKKESPIKVTSKPISKKPNLNKVTLPDINFEEAKKNTLNFVNKYSKAFIVLGYILIIFASFALVDFFVQYLNNDYSIAVVNGERISMSTYTKRLEQISGKDVSSGLIDEIVIRQAAKEKGFTVSSDEVEKYLNQYVDYFGDQAKFDAVLAERKTSIDDIKYTIETDLLGKQVVTDGIDITDETLKAFYDQYAEQLFPNEVVTDPTDSTKKTVPDFETKKAEVKDAYLNQQYSQNKDTWLASRKASVSIVNNYDIKPKYSVFKAVIDLIKGLKEAINKSSTK